jgi:hypothetical protein
MAGKGDAVGYENGIWHCSNALALGDGIAQKFFPQVSVRVHCGADFALAEVDVGQVNQQHQLAKDARENPINKGHGVVAKTTT